MQNKCINARFFFIFDSFMQSKIEFFAIYPQFWRPFWRPHFNIIFPLQQKPFEYISRRTFFFNKLKFKLYQIHLINHELIREMGVNSSDKPFRTVPHPSIHYIRSYVLHTGRCKGMAQVSMSLLSHRNSYYKYKKEIKQENN